jgi:hypothetical protein
MFGIVEWDTLAVTHYLATKPEGAVLVCLIVAIVLFAVAGVLGAMERSPYAFLIPVGLAVLALAFLL